MVATGDARIVRSRTKVLDAATAILIEGGPRALTVDAVSERSGVAKSTIYRHWDSRAEIVLDVIRRARPEPTPPPTSSFADALHDLVQQAATALRSPEWAHIVPILASLQYTMPEVTELMKADDNNRMAAIDTVMALGVDEGRFPDGYDTAVAAHLLLGPIVFATIKGRIDRIDAIAEAVAEQFLAANPAPASVDLE